MTETSQVALLHRCDDHLCSHGGTLEVQSEVGVTVQRILLVDDQADVREVLTDLLKALGHHVTSVADGADAVALIDRVSFDVLITDLGMPGLNGLEVAEHARASNPRMPVLLVTGWGTELGRELPEYVSLVLSKPFTLQSLGAALGRTLASADAGRP